MIIGPTASLEERPVFAITDNPPEITSHGKRSRSHLPTFVENVWHPPSIAALLATGAEIRCSRGVTRVALDEGSLVVNSSQGGGPKDLGAEDEIRRRMTHAKQNASELYCGGYLEQRENIARLLDFTTSVEMSIRDVMERDEINNMLVPTDGTRKMFMKLSEGQSNLLNFSRSLNQSRQYLQLSAKGGKTPRGARSCL